MQKEVLIPQNENDLEISRLLIEWYGVHRRDLPWRNTSDPYLIWVSEIILQQTRVAQGTDYFLRFVQRFPDVGTLAAATEDEVLKYWQGLGYYSRARNLHAAARTIVEQFGGVFPTTYEAVLSLKGIGAYTAAAIVSMAWNQPYAVVDGNVFRVLSRLFALDTPIDSTAGKKQFTHLAGSLIDRRQPGLYNQAIMDFGALQCVPQRPDCPPCPLKERCVAYLQGQVRAYPVKQNKPTVRDRYFHYLYIIGNGRTWLRRREEKDIWQGLYEFPLVETDEPLDFARLQQTEAFRRLLENTGEIRITPGPAGVRHVLSHQILHTDFYRIEITRENEALQAYRSVPLSEIDRYAVPRLIHIYLEKTEGNLAK